MARMQKKRNTPIATLIKNYTNKQSGKVSESRKEIQLRFNFLDWKDQKKILEAFLTSSRTDRLWAYPRLLDYWDKSFEPIVKELWEQYHESRCAWAVIRYFPVEYIKDNIDSFANERDYFFICLRLATEKNFKIEKEKLSENDYLAVLVHCNRNVSSEEATDILYHMVQKVCVCSYYEARVDTRYKLRGNALSMLDFRDISTTVYYLSKLDHSDVIDAFEEWNSFVQKNMCQHPDYVKLNYEPLSTLSDFSYWEKLTKMTQKLFYEALDDKYKTEETPAFERDSAPLERMIQNNPPLKKLVHSLDLEEINIGVGELPF